MASDQRDTNHHRLAEELCATMARLHSRGWCDGTGGNFSCVLRRQPLRLLMAPSGVDKGSVPPEALIEVDATGQVVRGRGAASAETLLHLKIVALTGAGAVLHTHSQAATLLSMGALRRGHANQPAEPLAGDGRSRPSEAPGHLEIADLEMLKGLAGIRTHATRVRIPVLANDQDLERLSDRAAPLLPQAPMGLLIAGHGLYAWGKDLPEARRHVEILEFLLEQRWRQLLLASLPATQDGVTGAARLGEPAAEGPGA